MSQSSPSEETAVAPFVDRWERSTELRDALSKLPGQLVLKSGLSNKRNQLVERWDYLESPGLDGEISSAAIAKIDKWIHEAEITILYILQLRKQEQAKSFGVAFAGDDEGLEYEVVTSIKDVDFVSDEWCWPWPKKKPVEKVKTGLTKKQMMTYGAVGALGLIAVMAYMDDEE